MLGPILNIIMGIVFILGGMSGTMVLRGTGSSVGLLIVGLLILVSGIVRLLLAPMKARSESASPSPNIESGQEEPNQPKAVRMRRAPVVRPWAIALVAVLAIGFGAPQMLKNFQMPEINPSKMVSDFQTQQASSEIVKDLAKVLIKDDVDSAEAFESARTAFAGQQGTIPSMAKALEKRLKDAPSLVVAEGSGEEAIRVTNIETRKTLSVSFAPDGEVLCKNGNAKAESAQKRRQAKKQAKAEALIAEEEKKLQQQRDKQVAEAKEQENKVNASNLGELIQDRGLTGSKTIYMAQRIFNDKSWKQVSELLAKTLPDDYSVKAEDGDGGAGKVLVTRTGALEHLTVEISCNNEEISAKVLEAPLDIGPES